MFNFLRKHKENKAIRDKIDLLRAKAEYQKAKASIVQSKSTIKVNKYKKFQDEYNAMQDIAQDIADDYNDGGWTKLLANPMIQQLIQAFLMKTQLGGAGSSAGLDLPEREKKIQELLSKIPPEVLEKAQKYLLKK